MPSALIRVLTAEYVKDYKLRVQFTDGVEGVVDFARWLNGEVFKPLAVKREFKRFFIAGGTVCWPNGADIAPETLRAVADVASDAA